MSILWTAVDRDIFDLPKGWKWDLESHAPRVYYYDQESGFVGTNVVYRYDTLSLNIETEVPESGLHVQAIPLSVFEAVMGVGDMYLMRKELTTKRIKEVRSSTGADLKTCKEYILRYGDDAEREIFLKGSC